MDAERSLSSHNIAFLEALYEQYEQDPASVDPEWRQLIEYERGRGNGHAAVAPRDWRGGPSTEPPATDVEQVALQNHVDRMIEHYRMLGHLRADLDPLGRPRREQTDALDLEFYHLGEQHLDRKFNAGKLFEAELVPLRDIIAKLQRTYTRRIGVEYWQIQDVEIRKWLRQYMESTENEVVPTQEEQLDLLRQLARADEVDKFLHNKFIGAKRFSVSGGESVIALLHTLLDEASELGVRESLIGMAHRGRLVVMMNLLGQTPAQIFSRFEGGDPWANLGSGDVKYHLGCYRTYTSRSGNEMYLALAFNPSHLEAITPVISGRVRASQDRLPEDHRDSVLGITLHGDAAVMGQGVYAETLNLSRLEGYSTQGSIRIIINNQVGFTTEPIEQRSTIYPTAVADMLNAPVFHVNGDDPEAAAYVGKLAIAFRQQFQSDVIIDIVCYRRFGHNEGDEPTFTQPQMYERIKQHPSVREIYQQRLLERGTVKEADVEQMESELRTEFEDALAEARKSIKSLGRTAMHGIWTDYLGGPDDAVPEVPTKVDVPTIERVGAAMTRVPEGFNLHPKLGRFVEELGKMARGEEPVSWAAGEHLAYGTLMLEGHGVRLSGQDAIRGTFTHRHLAWTDAVTGERYFPLQHIAEDQGPLYAYNSPLSEFAVMGFEFGYSLAAPDKLVIWEAQFGDFVNGAQVIIDQFLSSSEDKWNRLSALVLFLPHGFEGQGPEHSSARLERFLQLCAEDNMQVCNLTTPGQMFHVLRRQIHRRWRKPLIIMTPKSLLRTRGSFSDRSVLTEGSFQRFIGDPDVAPGDVRHVMACTGKVYYDLVAEREKRKRSDVAIVRVEQLYPFPASAFEQELDRYERAEKLSWVQEEPQNMGAWQFIRPLLEAATRERLPIDYVGRAASASPATGSPESHKLEQELILKDAFGEPDAS
jgi:2-oxoglutarate dehydrogenase E1 component